jgi:integrase
MSDSNSTPAAPSGKPGKPNKPYPDFPLFAHAAGVWAKKIRGKLHYFGKWDDPDAALDSYLKQKEDLHAGRKPREEAEGATVKNLCNAFLNAKQTLVDSGELSKRTWDDYKEACDQIIRQFGRGRLIEDIGPDDFAELRRKLARRWGPHRLAKIIQCVRCAFKFAADNGLTERVIRYGQGFKRPSQKTLRLHRAEWGPKLFTAAEVRKLLDAAGPQLAAMLLLGINCGFGNQDCASLPESAVDLDRAVIDFPRPKTGIPRRCVLWPETVEALREALAHRPAPKKAEHAGLVFVTKYGECWGKDTSDNPISKETSKLLKNLGINGRQGLGFYTLRHTFRTVADESKDQPAVDFIMGHEVPHMSAVYRETISDERLRAVATHVRKWLFPTASVLTTADMATPSEAAV